MYIIIHIRYNTCIKYRGKFVLSCPESSCRKRFKFNKCILKFKSSAFEFSFKIGRTFWTTQYCFFSYKHFLKKQYKLSAVPNIILYIYKTYIYITLYVYILYAIAYARSIMK